MKCLVKLALLTKAKMQVYSYLLVGNYSCVFVADIFIYVCVRFSHIFTVYVGIYNREKNSLLVLQCFKNLTKPLPDLSANITDL